MSIGRVAAKANSNEALRILFSNQELDVAVFASVNEKPSARKSLSDDADGVLKPR